MENEMQEYATFTTTTKGGKEIEMAVVDEFEYERKHYVVGAIIEDETINEDGMYIYRSVINGEDFTVEKIDSEAEYVADKKDVFAAYNFIGIYEGTEIVGVNTDIEFKDANLQIRLEYVQNRMGK